jgi:hypothetical protein
MQDIRTLDSESELQAVDGARPQSERSFRKVIE